MFYKVLKSIAPDYAASCQRFFRKCHHGLVGLVSKCYDHRRWGATFLCLRKWEYSHQTDCGPQSKVTRPTLVLNAVLRSVRANASEHIQFLPLFPPGNKSFVEDPLLHLPFPGLPDMYYRRDIRVEVATAVSMP